MTREEIVKALRHCAIMCNPCETCPIYGALEYCNLEIRSMAADMLEQDAHFAGVGKMVYCKDCAHLEYEDLGIYYCGLHRITGQLNPDDYCSRATAREEANE